MRGPAGFPNLPPDGRAGRVNLHSPCRTLTGIPASLVLSLSGFHTQPLKSRKTDHERPKIPRFNAAKHLANKGFRIAAQLKGRLVCVKPAFRSQER